MKDARFWNTIKNFNSKSIFSQYLRTSLVTVIVPLLILGACFLLYNNYKLSTEYRFYSSSVNEKVADAFDDIMEDVNDIHFALQDNTDIKKFFLFEDFSELSDNTLSSNEINKKLSQEQSSGRYIDSIYIYNSTINYLLGTNLSNFDDRLIDKSWLAELEKNGYKDYIILREGKYAHTDTRYVTVCRNVYSSKQYLGSYVFNISLPTIYKALYDVENLKDTLITLPDDSVIYSNLPEYTDGRAMLPEETDELFSDASVSKYGFRVYTSISENSYKQQFSFYVAIILLVFLLTLICSTVTAFILSRHLHKSVLDIIGILQQSELTGYNSRKETEYDFIHKSILSIKDNANSVEEELAEKLTQLKTYQLQVLQTQISPHFLNNTLNLIGLLDVAEHKKDAKIYRIIKLLSDLLSGVTDTTEYIIPLEKELEYTRKYLDIQNIKYNNKFNILINVEPASLKMSVLKFMLQPVVENAIIHGILGVGASHGTISINAYLQNGFLVVCVTNDKGVIEEERLTALNKSLEDNEPPESENIGLLNVNQRLNLVFGRLCSCKIRCDYDELTTTIIISIPSTKL